MHKVISKIFLFALFILPMSLFAQSALVMEIRAEIDPRMSRYVDLALEEAENDKYEFVIIDMDTYGGAVTDADLIRSAILEFDKPVYVFINHDAASAGALISIACDSIYMEPGSSIGAATVVTGNTGEAAPDKYQSYMRSMMRSTAEAKGRNPQIAEAMVDQDLVVEGVSEEGKVLTFSVEEAKKNGFCDAKVSSIDEILERQGNENITIERFELSQTEKAISLFLNPFVSGILILIILGGIYFELQTPGVGFPIAASFIAAILYFVPYYLNGLAANWEIMIFLIGLILIGLEVFVIPGFGIAGISGIFLSLTGMVLVMLNNNSFDFTFVDTSSIQEALMVVGIGLLGTIALFFYGASRLGDSAIIKKVGLPETMDRADGYTSSFNDEEMVGRIGVADTVLRPSGKIEVDGEIYDAYTRGTYVEKGTRVEVISQEGTSLKVREIKD
ncbi:NfeD family protein [Sediminitomix flava]|uniref:Membrane-bound serine protease (ClpP class) n=1 Tax=Sediminitomix flava TaxID=379075 RepID=A0A316A2S2_SEDFL|nr:NfeD family protein [Sediminitomix flava]PWJ44007.1 membrane-bound serine protease (ClpP class) [Sediminitomix flava]